MEYKLLLVISIILVLLSSWCLNTYIRLHKTMSKYNTKDQFNYACGMSKQYVNTGLIVSIIFLILGGLTMITSSIMIYLS